MYREPLINSSMSLRDLKRIAAGRAAFFGMWRRERDYSAHPCASPFGPCSFLARSNAFLTRLSNRRVLIIPPSPEHTKKATLRAAFFGMWRRERDSNPRYAINVYTLSRRAPSTTRTSLRKRGREIKPDAAMIQWILRL